MQTSSRAGRKAATRPVERSARKASVPVKVKAKHRPGEARVKVRGANGQVEVKAKAKRNGVARPEPSASGKPVMAPPVKVKSVLKARDLELFRELLLAKRRELLGDVSSMEEEALRSSGSGANLSNLPIHMADMGTDNYEQEFTLHLVQKDRELLHEINRALVKIREGTYGICEGTSKPISRARLEAKPWARYSIEYTRQLEKGLVRG